MKGTIIAANRNLGVIALQTETHGCMVLEVGGMLTNPVDVGEMLVVNEDDAGVITVRHPRGGGEVNAAVRREGLSRNEAIQTVSVV